MNSILLQKQVKENAMDLDEYCKSLKSWGEEMEKKEKNTKVKSPTSEQPNKESKNQLSKKQKEKSAGVIDYAKWNKFDAERECQRLDTDYEEDPELTDEEENDEDLALIHKANGNKFVKQQEWDKAIECYTQAIHSYNLDPIFYANRALCHLKKENYLDAEDDCSLSLKLDKTYVKALQRRAAAREHLGKFHEAIEDLNQVLQYESKNKESLAVLERIQKKIGSNPNATDGKRPVSIFTASRNKSQPKMNVNNVVKQNNENSGGDDKTSDIEIVKTIEKPPHLRSTKPLKRIKIRTVEETSSNTVKQDDEDNVAVKKHVLEKKSPAEQVPTPITNGACVVKDKGSNEIPASKKNKESSKCLNKNLQQMDTSKTNSNANSSQSHKNIKDKKSSCVAVSAKNDKDSNDLVDSPKTSIQFNNTWSNLKKSEEKYRYLKTITPIDIPTIFQESLEPNVLSNIINILATHFIKNNDKIYDYLCNLTKVKRFSALVFFLDLTDKQNLGKIIEYFRQIENKSPTEVDVILEKYKLD